MAEINIFFNDLIEEEQEELWVKVQKELLDSGDVSREKDESEEEFMERLYEETDHYINTHNFANKFVM